MYWEYILLYTDDALSISEFPDAALLEIDKYFKLKPDSMHPPQLYLGAKMNETTLPNGTRVWGISALKYIQDAIKNVERKLNERGLKITSQPKTPLSKDYRPEVDTSTLLSVQDITFYQSLIGSLRWMVEMG